MPRPVQPGKTYSCSTDRSPIAMNPTAVAPSSAIHDSVSGRRTSATARPHVLISVRGRKRVRRLEGSEPDVSDDPGILGPGLALGDAYPSAGLPAAVAAVFIWKRLGGAAAASRAMSSSVRS